MRCQIFALSMLFRVFRWRCYVGALAFRERYSNVRRRWRAKSELTVYMPLKCRIAPRKCFCHVAYVYGFYCVKVFLCRSCVFLFTEKCPIIARPKNTNRKILIINIDSTASVKFCRWELKIVSAYDFFENVTAFSPTFNTPLTI